MISEIKKAKHWRIKFLGAANNVKFQDLFALLYQEHDTWPEAALLTEVYQVAPKWALNPSQIAEIEKESDSGRGRSGLEAYDNADHNCKHPPSGANTDHCPDPSTMADIERECREMHQCKHDYFFTKQSELGSHIRQEWRLYREGRTAGTKHCKLIKKYGSHFSNKFSKRVCSVAVSAVALYSDDWGSAPARLCVSCVTGSLGVRLRVACYTLHTSRRTRRYKYHQCSNVSYVCSFL